MTGERCAPAIDHAWQVRANYDWMKSLSGAGWAWEYLRRSPDFRACWGAAQGAFDRTVFSSNLLHVRSREFALDLHKWGCFFADDPCRDARSAAIVWSPGAFPDMPRLIASPADEKSPTGLLDFNRLKCRATILVCGPTQFVGIRDGVRDLQFSVTGSDIIRPIRLLLEVAATPAEARRHARILTDLSTLRETGRLPLEPDGARPRPDRLITTLQALDGHLAGASHRDIGVALFGAGRIANGWSAHDTNLYDRVRRAIKRGQDLMRGRYRRLLR